MKKQTRQHWYSVLCRLRQHLVSQSHSTWKACNPDAPSYEVKGPEVNVSPGVQGGKNALGGAAHLDATALPPPSKVERPEASGDSGQQKQRSGHHPQPAEQWPLQFAPPAVPLFPPASLAAARCLAAQSSVSRHPYPAQQQAAVLTAIRRMHT